MLPLVRRSISKPGAHLIIKLEQRNACVRFCVRRSVGARNRLHPPFVRPVSGSPFRIISFATEPAENSLDAHYRGLVDRAGIRHMVEREARPTTQRRPAAGK